ncbi:MAG: hypothetical protein U0T83_07410 [Bacteriovoracaceae bacterium]
MASVVRHIQILARIHRVCQLNHLSLKTCQENNVPSFVKSCTYCTPGSQWDGKFDDSDCEKIQSKVTDGITYQKSEEIESNMYNTLLVILVGFTAMSNGICYGATGVMYAPDMWLSIAGSVTYITGEVIMATKFGKDMKALEADEDKLVGATGSTVGSKPG